MSLTFLFWVTVKEQVHVLEKGYNIKEVQFS